MNKISTSTSTNTLKGLAILIVLINHYVNRNIAGDSRGFANAWISIFFLLSGYGIFYSLNSLEKLTTREYLYFYYRRIARIFPLLWFAWLVEFIVREGNLSFWILTGIHAPGHYWFIPSILHCYLIAPFIYRLEKKGNQSTLIFIVSLVLFLNYLINIFLSQSDIVGIAKLLHFEWREYYFTHILTFGVGMIMSQFITVKQNFIQEYKVYFFWIGVLIINILMLALKFHATALMFGLIPIIMIPIFCYLCLIYSVEIRFLSYLGGISYSIYLFHMSYYVVLDKILTFPENSIYQLLFYLFTFPVFLFLCRYPENLGNFIYKKLVA